MNLAEEEYKKKKKVTTKKTVQTKTPEWFDKEIKEDKATEEEIKKLESRMKRG